MVAITELNTGSAHAVIVPELGGGIASLNVDGCPVLRPWTGDESSTFSLASNILVPFSNRISGGGFDWAGTHHPIEANWVGEALPIHGDGFQKSWSITQNGASAQLTLEGGAIGPWQYSAVQDVRLSEAEFEIILTVTNTGSHNLPFGCGFHPWFPRNRATRVSFEASGVWLENAQFLPTKELKLTNAPEWDFGTARPLPLGWINNAFTGWEGTAGIYQNEDAMSCLVEASGNLNTAIIYSPNAQADFFCFEPVSHPVDAFHLPGTPGLQELARGQSMKAAMKISWRSE